MDLAEKLDRLEKMGCFADESVVQALDEEMFARLEKIELPVVITQDFLNFENSERSESLLIQDIRHHSTEIEMEVKDLADEECGKDVDTFISYFNDRFRKIRNILKKRMELRNSVSIENLSEEEETSIIAMVREIRKTRSGNYILLVEDDTSEIKALIPKKFGESIVLDEVVGIIGRARNKMFFAKEVVWPDIPLNPEVNKFKEKAYIAFISDLQFGSKYFLEKKFGKAIKWLNTQNEITKKLQYIFIVGDIVDGIGIYPGHKKNLVIKDIYKQYDFFSKLIEQIPGHMQIVILPGNHDAVRLAEPQPKIPKNLIPDLYDRGNVHFLSNPAYVTLRENGNAINILLYHGYSSDEHINHLPKLRAKAYNDPYHCMVDFLKRRHLAPSYGVSPFAPYNTDNLVIEKVPDIFAMGHTHYFSMNIYKGINVISTGTFERETEYQKRMGHKPDPGKIAIIDLSTRRSIMKVF